MSDDKEYPPGSTAKPYYDREGNAVPLHILVKREPEWAINIIRHYEVKTHDLQQQLTAARERIETLEVHSRFSCYLLNKHEGDIIAEEYLQQWLVDMLAEEKAVEQWNTRPIEDDLQSHLTAARERIEALEKQNIDQIKSSLDTLNYYKPYLQIIPGVQEPDCKKLFQLELDLMAALAALKDNKE